VTHPRGFSVTEPSVAAVVGSLDSNTARYAARIRLQGHRIEIIQARDVVPRCHSTQLAACMPQTGFHVSGSSCCQGERLNSSFMT